MKLAIAVVVVLAVSAIPANAALTHGGGNPADASAAQCGTQTTPITYTHIIVIMDENLGWSYNPAKPSTAGLYQSPDAPYANALMNQCAAFKTAAATDPSQPNYMAATSGTFDAGSPVGPCTQCFSAYDNIFHRFDMAGLSWRSYEETMPAACSGSTLFPYKKGHNPAFWYTDLASKKKGGDGSCALNDAPYSLGEGLGTLPALSWVTPNMCEDMHWQNASAGDGGKDCPTYLGLSKVSKVTREQVGDQWLDTFLTTQVFNQSDYQDGSTLVILTWDEGNETTTSKFEDCPTVEASYPSCQIGTVLLSPSESGGVALGITGYSTYSILQTIQDNFFGTPVLNSDPPSPLLPLLSSYDDALSYPY